MPSLFDSLKLPPRLQPFRHYGLAIIIFLVGLCISLAAFHFYQKQDLNRAQAEFNRLSDLRLFSIKDIFLETTSQMESIKQFFYSTSSVSETDFQTFVRNTLNLYPNLIFIGWINQDLISHPQTKQSLGILFTKLNDLQPPSQHDFVPFTYLEKNNLKDPLYIDVQAYPLFMNLLNQSQGSSHIVLSTKINYLQKEPSTGFFLFVPVFSKETNNPKAQLNPLDIRGVLVGLSDFETILRDARSKISPLGINISIYDVSNGQEKLLHWSPSELKPEGVRTKLPQPLQQWERSHFLTIGNLTMKITTTPTDQILTEQKHWGHWEVPIIGIIISGLTSFYFLVMANRRLLIEQEVHERTGELASINALLQKEIIERKAIQEEFTNKQLYLLKRHEALEYLTKFTTSEVRHGVSEVILRTSNVLQIDRVSVWFYEINKQAQKLICEGLYSASQHSFTTHLELTSTHFPQYFEALATHSYLIIPSPDNAALNQELASYLANFHIFSKLDIPVMFEGKLLGVLCCEETRGHREWALEDRHFGHTMADIIAIMIQQSARRIAEKAFQESEERLRFVTQKAIDGIISINEKQEIISWNYGAEQMFGFQEIEMQGKSLNLVLPYPTILDQETSPKPIELKAQHKNGHVFPVEVSHTQWKSGDFYFNTIIIRDITERKENEKRIIKAMREAKAANAAKSEFLATISHELRTPLNAIIGFNQCLLMEMDGPLTEQQQVSLKKIEKSSFNLLSHINDILDFSKIEANKMELELNDENIVETLTSCVEEVQPLANQKNLDLQLIVDKPFILIEVDKIRIRQVFLNLLSNAIKFTAEGSIKVELHDFSEKIEVRVADTGIGLSPPEMEKIFHPFSQADSSITRRYGGTGLGLIISKKIIDLHGGNINVVSEPGKGSLFMVTLFKHPH